VAALLAHLANAAGGAGAAAAVHVGLVVTELLVVAAGRDALLVDARVTLAVTVLDAALTHAAALARRPAAVVPGLVFALHQVDTGFELAVAAVASADLAVVGHVAERTELALRAQGAAAVRRALVVVPDVVRAGALSRALERKIRRRAGERHVRGEAQKQKYSKGAQGARV
jgi:hypothetical protein